jgi:hypothetical protein
MGDMSVPYVCGMTNFVFVSCQFGDIVGFTAWASTREPTQVFILLEGLYSSFDKIALKRKVLKIETGTYTLSLHFRSTFRSYLTLWIVIV